MGARAHEPVLLEAVLQALAIREDGVYVDATFGRGGHSGEILSRLGEAGRLLAIDRDPEAVEEARRRFGPDNRFTIRQGPFSMMGEYFREAGLAGQVDGILLDLGVSSPQLDDAARGFSFRESGPLDMRMDPTTGESAAEWLNRADEAEIVRVLFEYGEERFARRIARAIIAARTVHPVETTEALAELVRHAIPARTHERGKDPATRSFQAFRIHINRELEQIEAVLPQTLDVLAPGGRLAVISFHSLEDRLVKQFMRREAKGDDYPPDLPVTAEMLRPRLRLIGKAVRATAREIEANPRARSAVLRIAERTDIDAGGVHA